MLCAIHQPNFFPWAGYFDKIARSDVFVFLDHVDYEKSGHSMQSITNRVTIFGGEKIHCPVVREHGPQLIDSVKIREDMPWRQDLIGKLKKKYVRAPYCDEISAFIEDMISVPTDSLSILNINAIKKICEKTGIETKFVIQSEMETQGHSSELLIDIIKKTGCSEYMHGKGGTKYQDDSLFEAAGIKLVPQDFTPWTYSQGVAAEFEKGLSIIDALYWLGFRETGQKVMRNL